jgi:hypothetical protein
VEEPNTFPVYGSDVNYVLVSVELSTGLQQVGGMSLPAGFSAAVTSNHQIIVFSGGPIPAGTSVDFVIEVIGGYNIGNTTILAEVDPNNFIVEVDENNNKASATILVWSIV